MPAVAAGITGFTCQSGETRGMPLVRAGAPAKAAPPPFACFCAPGSLENVCRMTPFESMISITTGVLAAVLRC
jgi:hypothetical protein